MKLSFVIPAYNEEHYIGDCLRAIIKDKEGTPYDIEIIVVSNASTDRTDEIVHGFKEVKLVIENKKGLIPARNAGFHASTGDIIAYIDADTRVTPGWTKKVMTAFEKNEKLVGFSGPFIYYDAPWKVRAGTRVFYYIGYFTYLLNRYIFHAGSMMQGGNFAVRKTALAKLGGYVVNTSFYGEDTDMARRLSKLGDVIFTFSLPAQSSGRRLAKEGGLTIGMRYAANYLWMLLFHRPFSNTSADIRLKNGTEPVYEPEHRAKEFAIGALLIIFCVAVIAGIAYLIYYLLYFRT